MYQSDEDVVIFKDGCRPEQIACPALLLEGTSMRFPKSSLEILRAVVVITKKKSTSRAGKELGFVSGGTKRIRVGEWIGGARLFHAAEEGLILTQAGELLYN